jgi:manganese/zinc/iron transport system permease protein
VTSAVAGYFLARWLDASIAGSMATMTGVIFALTLLLAPRRGLAARWVRHRRQRWQFAAEMLLVHLSHHEGTVDEKDECAVEHLSRHMKWSPDFSKKVVRYVTHHGLARCLDGKELFLTARGRELARQVMLR